ncbi:MAG TPA: PHP domain-containing protein, partial [Desulfatirhabdiaceae bacterium]|nr:PHP domain-containing protein [Desulfatirhabdiaceae bacterium]
AYVNKYRLDVETAIRLIRHAGGAPVLAHPGLLKADSFDQVAAIIHRFCQIGLAGLEVFYPEHTPEDIDRFTTLAHQTGLIMTGGTDFHGRLKPTIQLGFGEGNFIVPYTICEKLLSVIQ